MREEKGEIVKERRKGRLGKGEEEGYWESER